MLNWLRSSWLWKAQHHQGSFCWRFGEEIRPGKWVRRIFFFSSFYRCYWSCQVASESHQEKDWFVSWRSSAHLFPLWSLRDQSRDAPPHCAAPLLPRLRGWLSLFDVSLSLLSRVSMWIVIGEPPAAREERILCITSRCYLRAECVIDASTVSALAVQHVVLGAPKFKSSLSEPF